MSNELRIIDFHAHILPGADHGSSGLEESLNQLALIRAAGVDTVVATPHFYPHRHTPEEFLQATASAAREARPASFITVEEPFFSSTSHSAR